LSASWDIREGDALERLAEMPDESVQCCVTSPPYFGLRDYGIDGQIGLERSPDEFVARLVEVFREVRRVLRSDGTLWLNIGDSYCSTDKWGGGKSGNTGKHTTNGPDVPSWAVRERSAPIPGVKPKDLLGIPWLLAFALRADGWYLRSDVIWAKPNPMPESVTDRPTSAHEHVFLLAKSARYFYDADAIREPNTDASLADLAARGQISQSAGNGETAQGALKWGNRVGRRQLGNGRNKRNVWEVATQPYADAHFATFPPKLIEPCILAGSSPKACGECGAPWERVVEVSYENPGNRTTNGPRSIDHRHLEHGTAGYAVRLERRSETTGWQPSCAHDDDTGRSVILDPFAGAGTTGLVALRHDRSFLGVELNPAYADMARERIRQDAPLLNTPAEIAA
jgi:DNA modification methylase